MTEGSALRDDACDVLRSLDHPLAGGFLSFLDSHDDALARSCAAGHLTASALIVDQHEGRALLMLHAKVGRWLQMGGHCEPLDASLRAAALREAREESGIALLEISEAPVNLDRHEVRCDARVLDHLDVQFLAYAPRGALEIGNEESHGLRWLDLTAPIPADVSDAAVHRMLDLARAPAR